MLTSFIEDVSLKDESSDFVRLKRGEIRRAFISWFNLLTTKQATKCKYNQ